MKKFKAVLPIVLSALQHYAFCPRQCALIHLEQIWQDNEHTVLGELLHEHSHSSSSRMRDGIKIVTDLELQCARLGIHGKADVVEFHKQGKSWKPYPVEYKKCAISPGMDADDIQLCAQAFCLEEMLGANIPEGSIFYGESRRRRAVPLDASLRERAEETVSAVRAMLEARITPKPNLCRACSACSLKNFCLPEFCGSRRASAYLRSLYEGEG